MATAAPARAGYPERRSDRDHFVLAHRREAPRPRDPWQHQGVLVEREPAADGTLADVATVFLTGRECPWRCVMCDLWRHTIVGDTPAGAIPRQIAAAVGALAAQPPVPHTIKLYNAGSFFDARAVPPGDDEAIVTAVAPFAHVIVESHPALVGDRTWRLRDALAARGTTLEVAMGLETADPVAFARLNKGTTLERVHEVAVRLAAEGVSLRLFLLVCPPFVQPADQDATLDTSVRFALDGGASAISLIPTRPDEGALQAIAAHGLFTPPRLADVERTAVRALAAVHAAGGRRCRVFVDLWELSRFSTCLACAPARRARLETFNHTQRVPPPVRCATCGEATPA